MKCIKYMLMVGGFGLLSVCLFFALVLGISETKEG